MKSTSRTRSAAGIRISVVRLAHAEGLELPAYQTAGAAGLDLVAALPEKKPLKLGRGQRALVATGLIMALPRGFEAQVRPRSGLAVKYGVTVLNSPGTIDSDYRGEVQVLLVNLGEAPFVVKRGERIAQLVVAPVTTARLAVVAALGDTERGAGGFGSTGRRGAAKAKRGPAAGLPKSKAVPRQPRGAERAPARPAKGRRR